jgi:CRP-like cAMP-binding protein
MSHQQSSVKFNLLKAKLQGQLTHGKRPSTLQTTAIAAQAQAQARSNVAALVLQSLRPSSAAPPSPGGGSAREGDSGRIKENGSHSPSARHSPAPPQSPHTAGLTGPAAPPTRRHRAMHASTDFTGHSLASFGAAAAAASAAASAAPTSTSAADSSGSGSNSTSGGGVFAQSLSVPIAPPFTRSMTPQLAAPPFNRNKRGSISGLLDPGGPKIGRSHSMMPQGSSPNSMATVLVPMRTPSPFQAGTAGMTAAAAAAAGRSTPQLNIRFSPPTALATVAAAAAAAAAARTLSRNGTPSLTASVPRSSPSITTEQLQNNFAFWSESPRQSVSAAVSPVNTHTPPLQLASIAEPSAHATDISIGDVSEAKHNTPSIHMAPLLHPLATESPIVSEESVTAAAGAAATAASLQHLFSEAMSSPTEEEDEISIQYRLKHRRARKSCWPWLSLRIPERNAPFWHSGNFRVIWDFILSLITIINFLTLPVRIGLYQHWTHPTQLSYWACIDYPLDFIFWIDIFLRAKGCIMPSSEEYLDEQEQMHTEERIIDMEADIERRERMEMEKEDAAMIAKSSLPTSLSVDGNNDITVRGSNETPSIEMMKMNQKRNSHSLDPSPIHMDSVPDESQSLPFFDRYPLFYIYWRGQFFWDLIASIPLDFLVLLPPSTTYGVRVIPFFRLNRLIRLKRFSGWWSSIPDTIDHLYEINISPAIWRMINMLLTFVLAAHWAACIWICIGHNFIECITEHLDAHTCVSIEPNWLEFDHLEYSNFGSKYIRAFYGMTSTLMTVGLGDIRPLTSLETVFFSCIATLGAILCARATAMFASIFSKMDAPRMSYEQKMLNLKAYMHSKFLPDALQARVLYYHEYVWLQGGGMDEKKVLASLPAHLRMEALVFLEGDAIRKVPFFAAASSGLINSIALVLNPSLFSPDTYVQVKGQVGTGLFLVHKGECGRVSELRMDGEDDLTPVASSGASKILTVYTPGSYFGEMSLFNSHPQNPYCFAIKSFTFLELFHLSKIDFEKVMLLCCHNEIEEATREIHAMCLHQLYSNKKRAQSVIAHGMLGGGAFGGSYGEEDPAARALRKLLFHRHMMPSSLFRTIWTIASNLIMFYWIVTLPFRITYLYTPYQMLLYNGHVQTQKEHGDPHQLGGTPDSMLWFFIFLDGSCDVFFLLDMFLKARCFFFYRSFKEESRRQDEQRSKALSGKNGNGNDNEEDGGNNDTSGTTEPFEGSGMSSAYSAASREINTHPTLIWQRYKQSGHLLYDAISSIPFDWLIGSTLGWQWMAIPRLLRLARIYILADTHQKLRRWLLTKFAMTTDAVRLLTYFIAYCLLMHWCACIWYGTGLLSTAHDSDSWLRHERDPSTDLFEPPATDDHLSIRLLVRNYIRSFYFVVVITTTTAGYKDVLAYSLGESIMASFFMLTLALLYYAALGCISTVLTQLVLSERSFQEKTDALHSFLRSHLSPQAVADAAANNNNNANNPNNPNNNKSMKSGMTYLDGLTPMVAGRIKSYYTYLWERQRGVHEDETLAELPTALREEVASALNLEVLASGSMLFSGCSGALLKAILSKFSYHIFLPNEYICKVNEIADSMFIINRGRAVVLSANELLTFEVLNRHACYGDALFLLQLRRKTSVKTINFCDVSRLKTIDFQKTIQQFPLERQKIFENSVEVRKRQLRTDHAMEVNTRKPKLRAILARTFTEVTHGKFQTWSPTSIFVRNWQLLLMSLTIFHAIMIPLRVAFVHVTPIWVLFLEYGLDSIFILDIYFQYQRFSFIKYNGHLCRDPTLIAARYKKEGLYFDLMASLPLDIVVLILSRGHGNWIELMSYLRLPRLLRCARIPAYFTRLRAIVQEAEIGLQVNTLRLIELGIACMLIAHWLGCAFYLIARLEGGVNTSIDHPIYTWLEIYGIAHASITTQYLASLYWALSTITVVCYGDVIPHTIWEHVYVTAIAIVCFFLVAALIGNIASLITHLDAAEAELTHKLGRFDEYARRHYLPDTLISRVHSYSIYYHSLFEGIEEEELLKDMPKPLRLHVNAARYLRYLQPSIYFSFCESNILSELCDALKIEIFIPGDEIFTEGDYGKTLYIVRFPSQIQIGKKGVGGFDEELFLRRIQTENNQMNINEKNGNNNNNGVNDVHENKKKGLTRNDSSNGDVSNIPPVPLRRMDSSAQLSARSPNSVRTLRSPLSPARTFSTRGFAGTTGLSTRNLNADIGSERGGVGSVVGSDGKGIGAIMSSPRKPAGGMRQLGLPTGASNNPLQIHKRGESSGDFTIRMKENGWAPDNNNNNSITVNTSIAGNIDDELSTAHTARTDFTLRDILGTAMLCHTSYVQDGLLLEDEQNRLIHQQQHQQQPQASLSAAGAPPLTPVVEAAPTGLSPHSTTPPINPSNDPPQAFSVEPAPIILQLDEGTLLGELSFFLPLRRTASVYATSYCTFLALDRKPFNSVMVSLPHYITRMREIARNQVKIQSMEHANIKRNFEQHTNKLRKLCMVAATPVEKLKWGKAFRKRTIQRRKSNKHHAWLPDSAFFQWWKAFILLFLIYQVVVIPFRLCYFVAFPDLSSDWLWVDYALDGIFLIDLYCSLCRFGYIDEALGLPKTHPDDIWEHYLKKGWIKTDIAALIPFDTLIFLIAYLPNHASFSARYILFLRLIFRLPKLIRIVQLTSLVKQLAPTEHRLLSLLNRAGVSVSEGGVRFFKMLIAFLMIAHWMSGVWFIVGYVTTLNDAVDYSHTYLDSITGSHGTNSTTVGHFTSHNSGTPAGGGHTSAVPLISWLHQDGLLDVDALQLHGEVHLSESGGHIYARALYFSIKSLCTLGVADLTAINPWETFFAIFVIIISAVVLAAFVATFETTFHHDDEDAAAFHRKTEYTSMFMKEKNLPIHLQERITLYHMYIWQRSKGLDEEHALEHLSNSLRIDVAQHLNGAVFESVSVFKELYKQEPAFIKALISQLQAAVFMPDDVILRAGTLSAQMYFVMQGSVIQVRNDDILSTLSDGDWFGELFLFRNAKPTSSNFIAQVCCDVFMLSRTNYESVVEYWPKWHQLFVWKMNAVNKEKRKVVAQIKQEQIRKEEKLLAEQAAQHAALYSPLQEVLADAAEQAADAIVPPTEDTPAPLLDPTITNDDSASFAAPPALTLPTAATVSSSTGSGGGFSRVRSGSFIQHREQMAKRKRAEEVAAAAGSHSDTVGGSNAIESSLPSLLRIHSEHPTSDGSAPLRIHPGRVDVSHLFPGQFSKKPLATAPIEVPSFRFDGSSGPGQLPSLKAYQRSMSELHPNSHTVRNTLELPSPSDLFSPVSSTYGDEDIPNSSSGSSTTTTELVKPAPRRVSAADMFRPLSLPPINGVRVHSHQTATALQPIVYTPLPQSDTSAPSFTSLRPAALQLPPLSPSGVVSVGGASVPLLRSPAVRINGSGSSSLSMRTPNEPATLTFHLPQPNVHINSPLVSPLSPSPPSIASAFTSGSSSAASTLAHTHTRVWPPPELDVDDSVRDQLAAMTYVGPTLSADGYPLSPMTPMTSPRNPMGVPVGVQPLSPVLASWYRSSPFLPERLRFPADAAAAISAASTPLIAQHNHLIYSSPINSHIIRIDMEDEGHTSSSSSAHHQHHPHSEQGTSQVPLMDDTDAGSSTYAPSSSQGIVRSSPLGVGRIRSHSWDLSRSGPEFDLRLLLADTAQRVNQHLKQKTRINKRGENIKLREEKKEEMERNNIPPRMIAVALADESNSSSSSLSQPNCPIASSPSFTTSPLHAIQHHRRHSFNPAVLRMTNLFEEVNEEREFRSVFDF